ncbi:alpha/beta fold hydrolase [Rhodospirillaceae bacterium SYSU D60014]|uniref:alpha/beta fold hydrolase n=1 Tax=Virgifigura deserti TaxID=2268457 RepID=UPI0013C4DC6E
MAALPLPKPQSRNAHLLLGATAAALALTLPRRSNWRLPLAALGAAEVGWALLRAPSPAVPERAREAAPELVRSAMVEGILMRWEEHGERSGSLPVVMVHGLPTHPRAWRYVIPQVVRDGVCCLAWEQVGFGWSLAEGLGRDLSIPAQAAYLRAWLRHLGIDRALFVAHDYGGGVVQHLAAARPDLFMGLVLTDCVAYDNWPVTAVRTARALSGVIERLPPAMVKPLFLAALANLGHDDAARGAESAALHWQPYARPIGPIAFAHQLRHFSARDTLAVAPALPHLDLPVRIVWGEKDPLGLWSAERLAADLRAPLQVIPGGRHFTLEDHPDIIADAVHAILSEVKSGSKRVAG